MCVRAYMSVCVCVCVRVCARVVLYCMRYDSIGLADASFVARLLESKVSGKTQETDDELGATGSAISGIFKSEWCTKHFRRRPAVVVLFLDRDDVAGDPQRWMHAVEQIDTVRDVCHPRSVQLVICVAQSDAQDLPEDRCSLLRRRGDIDGRALVVFNTAAPDACLVHLCDVVRSLATLHYKGCIDRIRNRLQASSYLSAVSTSSSYTALPKGTIEQAIRCYIKLGFYGEYAADITTAIRGFSTAHGLLLAHKVGVGSADCPLQWQAQRRSVADMCNYRLCLLLAEAHPTGVVLQLQKHWQAFNDEFRVSTFGGRAQYMWPHERAIYHHAYMAHQFEGFAELVASLYRKPGLASSSSSDSTPTHSGARSAIPMSSEKDPCFYLQAAADHAIAQRQATEKCASMLPPDSSSPLTDTAVVRGHFLGTLAHSRGEDTLPSSPTSVESGVPMSDHDFAGVIRSASSTHEACREALQLLGRVLDGIVSPQRTQSSSSAGAAEVASSTIFNERHIHSVQLKLANEYLRLGGEELHNAHKLYSDIMPRFREEGWAYLLASALRGALRCARGLGRTTEVIALLLEQACLDTCVSASKQKQSMLEAMSMTLNTNTASTGPDSSSPKPTECLTLVCEKGGPLYTVFNVSVSSRSYEVKPREELAFEASILSNLPDILHVDAIEFSFSDPVYDLAFVSPTISKERRSAYDAAGLFHLADADTYRVALDVLPGTWLPVYGSISVLPNAQPKSTIVLEEITMYLSPNTCIRFPLCGSDSRSSSSSSGSNGVSSGQSSSVTVTRRNSNVGPLMHRRHGIEGAYNRTNSVGTCRPVAVRNDLAISRHGRLPVLSTHHAKLFGVALPVDQTYDYMTNEFVVLPAAAEADVLIYLRDSDTHDPLVGEMVAVNVDITPRGQADMRNPVLVFDMADDDNDGGGSESGVGDMFEASVARGGSKALAYTYRDGVLKTTTSLGVADGISSTIKKGATSTITFYLCWKDAATTSVSVILQYTTDLDEQYGAKEQDSCSLSATDEASGPDSGRSRSWSGRSRTTSDGGTSRHFECEQRITLTAIEPFHTEVRFEEAYGEYTLQSALEETKVSTAVASSISSPPQSVRKENATMSLPGGTDVLMVSTLTCFSEVPLEIIRIEPDPSVTYGDNDDDDVAIVRTVGSAHTAANSSDSSADNSGTADVEKTHASSHNVLRRGEMLSQMMTTVLPMCTCEKKVGLGRLAVTWRRRVLSTDTAAIVRDDDDGLIALSNGHTSQTVISHVSLPEVFICPPLCRVKCEHDDRAFVGTPFSLRATMYNFTNVVHELRVTVGDAGPLLYAGDRSSRVTLLPKSEFTVVLQLLSTAAGVFKLPPLAIASARYSSHMRTSTGSIHVLPVFSGGRDRP